MSEERHPLGGMIKEYDVPVTMRDGIKLRVDVYRPDAPGRFPVLYTCAMHNKDLQRVEVAENLKVPQPAWSTMWYGVIEGGDSKRFVANGYVHVIGQVRGGHKSEGIPFQNDEWDHYDTFEWLVAQPWCDGNIGMVGLSAFAGEQWRAAAQNHPALKAIFPLDAGGAYGGLIGFREMHPGGVLQTMPYHIDLFNSFHGHQGTPPELPPPVEAAWQRAMSDPDYMMYVHLWNLLTLKGQRNPALFYQMLFPFEPPEVVLQTEETFKKIKIPFYTGAFEGAYTYKMHWQGAQHFFEGVQAPKKLLVTPPEHTERPFHQYHDEVIRWYDHWLKGIDTGIMEEPPVKIWVMGANQWRTGSDWPLPETRWDKYYLHSWERLSTRAHLPANETFVNEPPDAFVQMPPTQTNKIERLRYMTDPLPEDTLVIGPISLTLYASLDETDTNWIVILKDVGPDVSVRTGRQGERSVPSDLPERELTRGWLKASRRAIDPERSKPWRPWHYLTPDKIQPLVPGEINEYNIEILSTANLFKAGHRICLDVTSLDLAEGVAGETGVEYIPQHVCSSKTVVHKVYHNAEHPSHLLLPIIPAR
ncbi:MAG: CocE/NonD family hydrolase [Deltaproteobacteria bacterium]|nr:CocE/NonD family hydrolase [Deltaproteobacteria bacterium]